MYCDANELRDPETRSKVQKRVEAVLAPRAHLVKSFRLTAPRDEGVIYLHVYWHHPGRADTVIRVYDEGSPGFEANVIGQLDP